MHPSLRTLRTSLCHFATCHCHPSKHSVRSSIQENLLIFSKHLCVVNCVTHKHINVTALTSNKKNCLHFLASSLKVANIFTCLLQGRNRELRRCGSSGGKVQCKDWWACIGWGIRLFSLPLTSLSGQLIFIGWVKVLLSVSHELDFKQSHYAEFSPSPTNMMYNPEETIIQHFPNLYIPC